MRLSEIALSMELLDEVCAVLLRPKKIEGKFENRCTHYPETVTDECVRKLREVQEMIRKRV